MITPAGIANVSRVSGYEHVRYERFPGRKKPYAAYADRQKEAKGRGAWAWSGPHRATALEAAQDYCDYVNGRPVSVPSEPTMRGGLRRAGHSDSRTPEEIPSDIEAAYGMIRDFKAQQAGKPGYVYLVVEDVPGAMFGKIGYSTNPQARVKELQTGNPRKLRLYASKLGTLEDEGRIHARFKPYNVLQEWFRLAPGMLEEFPIDEEEAA